MKKILLRLVAVAAVSAGVAGCGAQSTPSFMRKGPDLGIVLDRTAKVLSSYQNYLKKLEVRVATTSHLGEMKGLFRQVMNMDPKLYHNPIGIKMRKDASFLGFDDRNNDNVQNPGEKKLFKVEIDYHGRRLIATSETHSTAVRPRSGGFFVGVLMTNFESRQRAAGVDRKAFANRKTASLRHARGVGSGPSARRSGGRSSRRARGRVRSGGLFRGK